VNVAICARGKEDLEKAAADIGNHGTGVLAVAADVTDAGDVQRVVNGTVRKFGHLGTLITTSAASSPTVRSTPLMSSGGTPWI
jgi:NAD(P)-dependent dehydrogenase (short-subunit alcohol dehydrogenase family)